MEQVVRRVHRHEPEHDPGIPGEDAEHGEERVHRADAHREGPRRVVAPDHGERDEARDRVHDVVPAVHVEAEQRAAVLGREHRVADTEVGRGEEAEDPGGEEGDAQDEREDLGGGARHGTERMPVLPTPCAAGG